MAKLDVFVDSLVRATKTITFTGASGLGLVNTSSPIFVPTGRIWVKALFAYVSTTCTGAAGATLELGTVANTTCLIPATAFASLAAPAWWHTELLIDSTPRRDIVAGVNSNGMGLDVNSGGIACTARTANITGGVIVFESWYMPLSSGASLT